MQREIWFNSTPLYSIVDLLLPSATWSRELIYRDTEKCKRYRTSPIIEKQFSRFFFLDSFNNVEFRRRDIGSSIVVYKCRGIPLKRIVCDVMDSHDWISWKL